MNTFTISNLSAKYSNDIIINNIDMTLKEGSLVSITGPSGCGKSTLLKALAGFNQTNGTVFIDNMDILTLEPYLRPITLMFQEARLFPHLTVKQNILFPTKMNRFKINKFQLNDQFISNLIDDIGLSEFSNIKPAELSGGQKQRVSLARAVASLPRLLLLDEPFSALDDENKNILYELLLKIRKKYNLTILMITHSISEALAFSDSIAVMDKGQIIQLDSVKHIIDKPKNLRVAKIIKSGIFCETKYLSYRNISFQKIPQKKHFNCQISQKQLTSSGYKYSFSWNGVENILETSLSVDTGEYLPIYYEHDHLIHF